MRERSGPGRRLITFAVLILAVSAGSGVRAQHTDAPPTAPILRLNTTAHTARILRIATDRENRYVVTASDDKTARVWSLPEGRLLIVLRVPIGEGDEGKLNAVAMTPDGDTVALGGWTGASGTQENVYLFDRASGSLQRRLSGLPNVVNHLAYSADGRLLAARTAFASTTSPIDTSRYRATKLTVILHIGRISTGKAGSLPPRMTVSSVSTRLDGMIPRSPK